MALLEVSEGAVTQASAILTTLADNWIALSLFCLLLGVTGVLVYLFLTQTPRVLKSWTNFIEVATENIPRLTDTINKLVNSVSLMNDKLSTILSLESKIDHIKDQIHENEKAIYNLKDKLYENDSTLQAKLDLIFTKL